VTLAGLIETEGPAGDELAERFTVPVKPLKLATVMVEVADELDVAVKEEGLAEIAKSGDLVVVWRNSVIAEAPASLLVRPCRFQFASIVFVKE
jgi:hypothetical protein